MKNFLEKYIACAWNRHVAERSSAPVNNGTLDIGARVVDGEPVGTRVGIAQNRRAESIALVGKSGSGKTKLIRKFKIQDVEDQRYFADTDLHGEEMNFTLKVIAQKERTLKKDLSGRVIAIDLGDPKFSVGINPLEGQPGFERFTQIAEIAQILKDRFHLDTLGARTEELLRNTLYALAENDLT